MLQERISKALASTYEIRNPYDPNIYKTLNDYWDYIQRPGTAKKWKKLTKKVTLGRLRRVG
jgi:hypothetical protein